MKTKLTKLIKRHGSKEMVALKLGITVRYVEILLKGDLKPSKPLQKLIDINLISTM